MSKGISISQAIAGTIPNPTHKLKWGEDIPRHILEAMERGETALLYDESDNPFSIVFKDYFGTIREKRLTEPLTVVTE